MLYLYASNLEFIQNISAIVFKMEFISQQTAKTSDQIGVFYASFLVKRLSEALWACCQ